MSTQKVVLSKTTPIQLMQSSDSGLITIEFGEALIFVSSDANPTIPTGANGAHYVKAGDSMECYSQPVWGYSSSNTVSGAVLNITKWDPKL